MTWYDWNNVKGYIATGVTKATKVAIIQGMKQAGAGIAKCIPVVGNVVGAVDDIYQDYKIGNLQTSTAALQESQSVLQGQMQEVQFGLERGKAQHSELSVELNKVREQLKSSSLSASEVKKLQIEQKALKSAVEINENETKQLKLSQEAINQNLEFLDEKQKRLQTAISILEDKSLAQEEQMKKLEEIVEAEKQRVSELESNFKEVDKKVEFLDKKIQESQEKIEVLEENYKELKDKVSWNTQNIEVINNEIAELMKMVQEQSFKLKSVEEKFDAVLKYTRLKEEKAKLEKELRDYLGVPTELPETQKGKKTTEKKLFNLWIDDNETKENIITFGNGYYLKDDVYDFYLNKFGSETMEGWIRCEDGEFSRHPARQQKDVEKVCQILGFNDKAFPEEKIMEKKELVYKLQSNVDLLNEIAQLFDFENHEVEKELIENPAFTPEIGNTASTDIPWFWIIGAILIAIYFYQVSSSRNNKRCRSTGTTNFPSKNDDNLLEENNNILSFVIFTAIIIGTLFGIGKYLESQGKFDQVVPITEEKQDEKKEQDISKEKTSEEKKAIKEGKKPVNSPEEEAMIFKKIEREQGINFELIEKMWENEANHQEDFFVDRASSNILSINQYLNKLRKNHFSNRDYKVYITPQQTFDFFQSEWKKVPNPQSFVSLAKFLSKEVYFNIMKKGVDQHNVLSFPFLKDHLKRDSFELPTESYYYLFQKGLKQYGIDHTNIQELLHIWESKDLLIRNGRIRSLRSHLPENFYDDLRINKIIPSINER